MTTELLAGPIFLVIYALIVTERIHRTVAAMLGAVLTGLFQWLAVEAVRRA